MLFFIYISTVALPILALAPTHKVFIIFTLQTGKTVLGVRKKLLMKTFIIITSTLYAYHKLPHISSPEYKPHHYIDPLLLLTQILGHV